MKPLAASGHLLLVICACACHRRRKSEQAQQLMLWKIDWEDIDFLSSSADSNLAKSTVLI